MEREVYRVKVGPKGRLVIPAPLRRHLGIEEGDIVAISLTDEGDALELITPEAALTQIQRMVADKVPADVDLVAELIEERKLEAAREMREYEEAQRWLSEQRKQTGT